MPRPVSAPGLSPAVALAVLTALGSTPGQAGPNDIRPLSARSGLPPFAYTNAADALPNYLPGQRWGTQGEPIRTMQQPLDPAASARHLVVQPGFDTALYASEPDIRKPIALAWDHRGRLFIAETIDYPNEQQPDGEGRDRITVCTDTDGDGKADRFTVFADHLSIPTSLCFANGGLLVTEGGHTLFLRDTDGDDVADERRVLFEGWGMGDTHATVSNLRYGPDNWIWATVGYSGFNGEVGGRRHRFGQGVLRFRPDGSELEFIRSSNNNTWGLGISEDGTIFGSTANNNASWHMAVPNRAYEAVRGWSASRMETIADDQGIYPVTEKVRQVDQHHRYTAGAGHALYTARAFPREFWNTVAFVTEPTGHLVGWFRMDGIGSDYRAVNLGSFLASDDEWTAPIVAEVGPDGALWVIDWYNYIVQHNPVPQGFKNGRGNAYETSLRDKRHGRIYRVTHPAGKPTAAPRLDPSSPSTLVAGLGSDNQLWRFHAQRLLVERGAKDVVPALQRLVAESPTEDTGLNPAAMHALWTLAGLGATGPETTAALRHPAAGVRRAAASVLPPSPDAAAALLSSGVLSDRDPQVRLAAFLALAEQPPSPDAGVAVAAALRETRNATDRWLRDALAAAGARHLEGFGRGLIADRTALHPEALPVVTIVARHYAADAPGSVEDLLAALPEAEPGIATAIVAGLEEGWPTDRNPVLGEDRKADVRELLAAVTDPVRAQLLLLLARWEALDAFAPERDNAVRRLVARVADSGSDDARRIEAARLLIRLDGGGSTLATLIEQAGGSASPNLSGGLLAALALGRNPDTTAAVLAGWPRLTPAARKAAVAAIGRRPEWTTALLDAVQSGALRRTELGPEQWQALRNSRDRSIARRAAELASGGAAVSADREAVLKQFQPAASRQGDAARGETLFTANCAVCHTFNGKGQQIGPDLTGIGARPSADVLTEILDPNRSVESNFILWTVTTKDGETLSGRLDSETQTGIDLLDLTGRKHSVQRAAIASLESSGQSIMPTGFESIGEAGLADLLTYLATSTAKP